MSANGRLFVIEGPDGAGKSTIIANTLKQLSENGLEARSYAFPGKELGSLGEVIYRIHHNHPSFGIESICPEALQALHIAAHIDLIENQIKPQLADGKVILLDRFWWSTWVYGRFQGASNAVLEALIDAEKASWAQYIPTHLFLLNAATARRKDGAPNWKKLCSLYRDLARHENGNYPISIIENEGTAAEATKTILKIMKNSQF